MIENDWNGKAENDMEKRAPHIVPSIYLVNYLNEFEGIIQADNVTLKKLVQEHGLLAGELLKENCDFIGYMFLLEHCTLGMRNNVQDSRQIDHY